MTEAAWNAGGMRGGERAPKAELRVERAPGQDTSGMKGAGALPPLRADLRLHEGPSAADGAPTWVIEDPARDRFFQIGRLQGEILSRWRLGTAAAVAGAINKDTLLRVTEEDVTRFARFLAASGLLSDAGLSERLITLSRQKKKETVWQFLLHHYLFFRIPLVDPDAFLRKTLPTVERIFFSRAFWFLTLAVLVLDALLVGRQWESFTHAFLYFFTWQGAVAAAVTLICTKVIHELGHAYTAEHFGCRIPAMGVAFMVMMPLLYTDTTAAWRLKDKKQRLLVCSAGVISELTIGVWAALAWCFLPDGVLRSACFTLATTTWVMTLAVNMSPFMRFDGYYFLSDLLGVANLHARSFAAAKTALRRFFLGTDEPYPETFDPGMKRTLILYAFGTWLYRLIVFFGIALIVYHAFFKALGILLFSVEVSVFILLPIMKELRNWFESVKEKGFTRRGRMTAGGLALLFLLFLIPWNTSVTAPAISRAGTETHFYTPAAARVTDVKMKPGAPVKAGEVLAVLESPELARQLARLKTEEATLAWRSRHMRLNRETASDAPVASEELAAVTQRISVLEREISELTIRAPSDGRVADAAFDLHPGEWLKAGEWLAVTVGEPKGNRVPVEVTAYVSETDLHRIREGTEAKFIPGNPSKAAEKLKVFSVGSTAVRLLSAAPELASSYGGPVAARAMPRSAGMRFGSDSGEALVPQEALYQVVLKGMMEKKGFANDLTVMRGHVVIDAPRSSPILRFLRYAASIVLREVSF